VHSRVPRRGSLDPRLTHSQRTRTTTCGAPAPVPGDGGDDSAAHSAPNSSCTVVYTRQFSPVWTAEAPSPPPPLSLAPAAATAGALALALSLPLLAATDGGAGGSKLWGAAPSDTAITDMEMVARYCTSLHVECKWEANNVRK
jgi:hypothetical protein